MPPETNRKRLIKKALATLGGGKRVGVVSGVEVYQLDRTGERIVFKTATNNKTKPDECMFGITPGWRKTCQEKNLKIYIVVEEGFGWVSHEDIDDATLDASSKKRDGSVLFHHLFVDKSQRVFNKKSIKQNKSWGLRDFTPFS